MNTSGHPPSNQKKPLRRLGGQSAPRVRMVCFPWSGAGASVYRRFVPHLPDYMELHAVQLPGREDRFSEPCLRRVQQAIDMVLPHIVPLMDRPLVLFGHSMGALLAYETARALHAQTGREPDLLIASGRGAPHIVNDELKKWHVADDDTFIEYMRQLGGTPDAVLNNSELMQTLIGMLKADYEILETYVCTSTAPLACPLVACAGNDDNHIRRNAVEAWTQCTTGASKVHWFAGDHFYLSAHTKELMVEIDRWILEADLLK